jgi:hypothetical protein
MISLHLIQQLKCMRLNMPIQYHRQNKDTTRRIEDN